MPAHPPDQNARGDLIAIGGAEDKTRERHVLGRLVGLAGGADASIAIFPVASTIPSEVSDNYVRVFRHLGASRIHVFDIRRREEAFDPERVRALEECSLIFFTGGDQLRLVVTLGGTPLVQKIRRMHAHGVPVAGTSAGAAALCQHMIARGRSGQVAGRHMVNLAAGLGLTNRIVLDQHFSQRHRMGRLFSAVALNPFLIGVGIDEDTAACLDARNRLTVWGKGSVTIVDGADIAYTNVHEVDGRKPASVVGLHVHVLTAGGSYDLVNRAGAPAPVSLLDGAQVIPLDAGAADDLDEDADDGDEQDELDASDPNDLFPPEPA